EPPRACRGPGEPPEACRGHSLFDMDTGNPRFGKIQTIKKDHPIGWSFLYMYIIICKKRAALMDSPFSFTYLYRSRPARSPKTYTAGGSSGIAQ
ncbi:MAG: hypothetical protein IJM93_05145, partial [Oscillospiraceae bacterium]|nr:hypothetical protein [Oscillospiraceae bacterium]